jgi:hypothetical protein
VNRATALRTIIRAVTAALRCGVPAELILSTVRAAVDEELAV